MRTLDETDDDQAWTWVLVIGTVAGGSGLVLSVIAAVNWRRRHRAVLATGWRIASVTVVPDYPVRRGRHLPDIEGAYRDGPEQTAFAQRKLRRFLIAMAIWYALLITTAVLLLVRDLLWPLVFVGVVGSLAPALLAQVHFTRTGDKSAGTSLRRRR
ncbi:hypothetical protein [Amycolatopsis kentuckyensis]|uniref:hypothetical protein n=1 Tax=Amycolatopsis kentuckyensis TaxID=218823 RepID=UPI000A38337D|nr:hypothetical protein [Amycolatopsis kentuckyensis]